ncbi:MAG TPA: ORF6N domain-containing protein [Steroidobacteraceae bacterium]|nr:ORF6N domain-containing protein [Steroidobacteraceae bacterium]
MPARTPDIAFAAQRIGQFILVIRRQRVLLDEDLAALYGVETRGLLQAVKRNRRRFPPDFIFELSAAEWRALRSQSVTSKLGRGGRRYAPYAFTEQGVAMLSSVLNSDRAIAVNIQIMRTFVRIRNLLATNKTVAQRFERLERKSASHDQAIVGILSAIRELTAPTQSKRRGIGFTANLGD